MLAPPAFAGDWGYDPPESDDTVNSVKELEAKAGSLQSKKTIKVRKKVPVKKKSSTKKGSAYNKTSGTFTMPDSSTPEFAWLQIFGLVKPLANSEKIPDGPLTKGLTKAQMAKFLAYIRGKLKGPQGGGFRAIETYWPSLQRSLGSAEHRANYRLLFRALLRMKAEEKGTAESEKHLLLEAIGPTMIAETKPPKLSSEAIDAYTDMACFLYAQTHPGKTVDFDDNRKLFALVIRDKFKKAPAYADRLAMSYFPVNWAKFRILYTDATDGERKVLVEKLAKKGKQSKQKVKNELLEKVLSCGPWKNILVAANRRTQLVGQKAKVKALSLTDFN